MGTRVTKNKFHAIMREYREIEKTAPKMLGKTKFVANNHGVSVETVASIKRAGTWPAFITAKQERLARRADLVKVPESTETEQAPSVTTSPDAIDRALERIRAVRTAPVTREEFDGLYNEVRRLRDIQNATPKQVAAKLTSPLRVVLLVLLGTWLWLDVLLIVQVLHLL